MKRTLTDEQKEQARLRREKFRGFVAELAKFTPEQRAELAAQLIFVSTVDGHTLSPANQLLIAYQRSNCTLLGGFRQWKAQGRSVKKGEHGLMIWCPMAPGKTPPPDTPQPEEMDGAQRPARPRFIVGTVFDISQTCEQGAEVQP